MLYELTLFTSYFNQLCINRWNWLMTGTPAAALGSVALVNAFGAIPTAGVFPSGSIFAAIKGLLSNSVIFTQINARALYDVVDFYETPFPANTFGAVTGDSGSPVDAYGFRTNRVRTDIRRATKRFVGVAESQISTGGSLNSSAIAAVADLATKMSTNLSYDDEGNTLTFTPVVLKKEKYTVPGSDPVRYAYRYFPTEAEQLDEMAEGVTWEAYTTVRSQTSRQYGRGQ